MNCNNAGRGRSANKSRTLHGIYGNFAAVKQLLQNEQFHLDDPLRCQMGLDNGNRSWQRRTILWMAACFLGLPSTGSCRYQRQDPEYRSRPDFLTPIMIQERCLIDDARLRRG